MSVTDTRAAATPGLEKLAVALLFGFVASLQISIAAADILLSAMLVCWVAMLVVDRRSPAAPAFFIPLAAYGAMTLISSLFSLDPMTSLIDCKQLVLFAIVPAVYEIARGKRAATVDRRHRLGRRRQRGVRHHPVRPAALRQPRAASRGRDVALHDLLRAC